MKISNWGMEYEVKVEKSTYAQNGNLAVVLKCYDEEYNYWEPYGSLTINLLEEKLPENMAYVDVHNMPNAEAFIEKYHLGEPTNEYGMSGFCVYPLYRFY